MAGGMTLIPTLKQRLAKLTDVIDLAAIKELKGIKVEGKAVTIGAMTPHHEVASSIAVKKAIPALAALAAGIGDPHVRHRGTIGGAVANNDPTADYTAAVLALNATVKTNKRSIAADSFFKGLFETALGEGELITAVSFPVVDKAAYMKFANPASRYAIVGVFVAKSGASVRTAVTGAASCVFRCAPIETALAKSFAPEAIASVMIDGKDFNSDIHASAEYRAHLVRVMAQRAVAAAA